jgi:hypothetical protein
VTERTNFNNVLCLQTHRDSSVQRVRSKLVFVDESGSMTRYIWGGRSVVESYAPADRLADSCQKVLGLLRNGRKGLEDDVTILWTDPERT